MMNEDKYQSWLNSRKRKLLAKDVHSLFQGICNGDINALSQGITLIESTLDKDQEIADELVQLCLTKSGNSFRIGITGVPGVGKSSFIEGFGLYLIEQGHKVAILAIDPSSERTSGSILGDKTRMERLSMENNAFIRPSPAGDSLGGVARKTRESIYLCEAAGFDKIIIETVGVGQSETSVHSMVDFFMLLMLAGAGDELQGIKRGIMEMADLLVVTKADGDNATHAKKAKQAYQNALHLFPMNVNNWTPKSTTSSIYDSTSYPRIHAVLTEYEAHMKQSGWFQSHRKEQDLYWLEENIKHGILAHFLTNKHSKTLLTQIEKEVLNGQISSYQGAKKLVTQLIHGNNTL